MPTSTQTLDALFADGAIDLDRGPLLDTLPTLAMGPLRWERVEGMMLGLAVGDALGSTCEGADPSARGRLYGEVRDYQPNRHAGNLPYGLPSDDTQLAFWTLECLLADGQVIPEHLLDCFAAGTLFGGGNTLRTAFEAWRDGTRPWHRAAPHSAGNGALMRIAPVILPAMRRPSTDLWADAALAAMATHNDRASTSACLAWVHILWQLLQMSRAPEPDWWLNAYVEAARPLEGESCYTARYGNWAGTTGPLWRYAAERVSDAWRRDLPTLAACDEWGSGAYLLETVPSVLYILMRCAGDPEEALVRAVNDTYDNDTVAAIVGTAVGALHGKGALPTRWLDGLSGRTRADDPGHVYVLLERARQIFGEGSSPRPAPVQPDPAPTRRRPAAPKRGGGIQPIVPEVPSADPSVGGGARPAPIPESYWVVPGRLLAGEYPGAKRAAEARARLRAFLKAGIDLFVDLTEASEGLEPYAPTLTEEAAALGRSAEHVRMGIRDVSVPNAAFMADVLDTVDEALAAGRCAYVHCLGGIGRTGTVVGCYLVRHGLRGDQALERVQALLDTTPKAKRPSPEAPSQAGMVRAWAEHDRPTLRGRFRGSLVGLACGDALGATLEFTTRGDKTVRDIVGGGPFNLKAGQWTDDTSMALCLAESLIEREGFDPRDQMDRYVLWKRQGHLSSTGVCFDIGNTTADSLERYRRTGDPYAGPTDPRQAGNGSLMRLAPLPLFAMRDARLAFQYASDGSRTTHGARAAVDACRYLAALIVGALRGARKEDLLAPRYTPLAGYWGERPLCAEVDAIAAGSFARKAESEIKASGYVLHTLEAALWAFSRTATFEEGALLAVNLAEDADTSGAVYGQLAGAYYGLGGIPARWRRLLYRADLVTSLADGLYRLAAARPLAD